MGNVTINPAPGSEIRRLREERHLRPVDIQRVSDTIKRERNCSDFGISHATLSDIENEHSVPNVRKMFSLAVCFRLPMEDILALYGASPDGVRQFYDTSSAEIRANESAAASSGAPSGPLVPAGVPGDWQRKGPG